MALNTSGQEDCKWVSMSCPMCPPLADAKSKVEVSMTRSLYDSAVCGNPAFEILEFLVLFARTINRFTPRFQEPRTQFH